MRVVVGSYAGNGSNNRWIECDGGESLGAPDAVYVIGGDGSNHSLNHYLKTLANTNNECLQPSVGSSSSGIIIGSRVKDIQDDAGTGEFQVTNSWTVNRSGTTYEYIAFFDDGTDKVSTVYRSAGTGDDDYALTTGLTTSTLLATIAGHDWREIVARAVTDLMAASEDTAPLTAGGAPLADCIQDMRDSTTTVEIGYRMNNGTGDGGAWVFWDEETDYIEAHAYSGNGTDDREITLPFSDPDVIFVIPEYSSGDQGIGIWFKSGTVYYQCATAGAITDGVKSVSGTTLTLGDGDSANGSNYDYHLLCIKDNEGAASQDLTGAISTVTVTAHTGAFSVGAVALSGSQSSVTVTAQSGTLTPGAIGIAGAQSTVTVTAQAGAIASVTPLPGAQSTVTVTAQTGAFSPGGVGIAGSQSTVTVTAQTGDLAPGPITLAGSQASVTVTAQAGTLVVTQALTGALSTVTVTAQTGAFSVGAVGLAGAQSPVTVTAQDGALTPGAIGLAGAQATVTVTAQAGDLALGAGTQNLTGVAASVTVTAQDGAFTAGAIGITGSASIVTVTAQTGTLAAAASALAGSISTVTVTTQDGALTPGAAALAGALSTVTVTAQTGALSGGSAVLSGAVATVTVTAQSGSITLPSSTPADDDTDSSPTNFVDRSGATIRAARLTFGHATNSLRMASLANFERIGAAYHDRHEARFNRSGRLPHTGHLHHLLAYSTRAGDIWAPVKVRISHDTIDPDSQVLATDTTSRVDRDGASLRVATVELFQSPDSLRAVDRVYCGDQQDRTRRRYDVGLPSTGRTFTLLLRDTGRAGSVWGPLVVVVTAEAAGDLLTRAPSR